MKAFAVWVMKGRMQAVIAVTVSAVLALIVTPLSVVSAAVVMLAVLRQGWREGLLVVLSSLLALGGLGGLLFQMPIAAALMGLVLWAPAAALGAVLGRSRSLRVAIEAAALGGAAVVLAQYALMGDPAAYWTELLNEFVAERVDPAALQGADLEALVSASAGWMAGGLGAAWFLATLASLLLARYWSTQIDSPGAFGVEFRALRFGRVALLVVPMLLVFGVLITGGEPNLLGQLFLVGMLLFLLQGISVAHALVADFSAPVGWLIGFYAMLVLVAPHAATAVAMAGYADGWMDFRARARARRSGGDDG
jgi:hypothetical protein